jgi:hypothetical protein
MQGHIIGRRVFIEGKEKDPAAQSNQEAQRIPGPSLSSHDDLGQAAGSCKHEASI